MASNPAAETKIELVTEAIETLVLATVVAHANGGSHHHKTVVDSRKCLHDSLRELLTPTLRVVAPRETIPAPDARPAYPTA